MRLHRITIRNFRLLRRVCMNLSDESSTIVLVGPNNSGKTSVMDAIRCFTYRDRSNIRGISIHDISKSRMRAFKFTENRLISAHDDDTRVNILRRYLPVLRLSLTFKYSDTPEDINLAKTLLMDLKPDNNEITICIHFSLQNALDLLTDYLNRRKPETTSLYDVVASNLHHYYGFTYSKMSSDGTRSIRLADGAVLSQLIRVDTISAQRHLADDETGRTAQISRMLHRHYLEYFRKEEVEEFNLIEDALLESSETLTSKYEKAFVRLISRLRDFGYPQGTAKPEIKIRAEMNSETVYRDNTRVYYAAPSSSVNEVDQSDFDLPERYNGLGYKNLIFIVLQLETYRADIEANPSKVPGVHLICIEEPEAHLHPQMQTIFIKEISRVLEDDQGPTAQVILSTHSPHIVSDSGFQPIRYFKRRSGEIVLKDLSKFPLSDSGEHDEIASILNFLRKYLKITHCDLLFADKAILIEGQVEKLLLPTMIEQVAATEGFKSLSSQYISILDIGGAHAHKIDPFLRFIEIPALVISDIDSANADRKKCPVVDGEITTNAAIRFWLPDLALLEDLHNATEDQKVNAIVRIAYQTHENGHCGRSFEEAFVYSNMEWMRENIEMFIGTKRQVLKVVENELPGDAYDFGSKIKKVDFALDLLGAPGWQVPEYIEQGLQWLCLQEHAE